MLKIEPHINNFMLQMIKKKKAQVLLKRCVRIKDMFLFSVTAVPFK